MQNSTTAQRTVCMQQKVGPTLSYKEEISSINPHDPENWDWKKILVCNLSLFGLEGENVTQRGGVPFQTPPGLSRGTVSTSCAFLRCDLVWRLFKQGKP